MTAHGTMPVRCPECGHEFLVPSNVARHACELPSDGFRSEAEVRELTVESAS